MESRRSRAGALASRKLQLGLTSKIRGRAFRFLKNNVEKLIELLSPEGR